MYSNTRENNNILNPSGQPLTNEGYKPERAGYNNFGQN